MNRLLFNILSLLLSIQCLAQLETGAPNLSLSGASSTQIDEWSLYNNAGTLGRLSKSGAAVSYQSRFGIKAFQNLSFGLSSPLKNQWGVGLGFSRFGDDVFNRQIALIGIGNKIQMVSLGVSSGIVQYHVEGQQSRSLILINFGGTAEISKQLMLAAHISNITQSEISEKIDFPVTMKVGLDFHPIEAISLLIELHKQVDLPAQTRIAFAYKIDRHFGLSGGFVLPDQSFSLGTYVRFKRFKLDYGFASLNHQNFVHEISLSYQLSRVQ